MNHDHELTTGPAVTLSYWRMIAELNRKGVPCGVSDIAYLPERFPNTFESFAIDSGGNVWTSDFNSFSLDVEFDNYAGQVESRFNSRKNWTKVESVDE